MTITRKFIRTVTFAREALIQMLAIGIGDYVTGQRVGI